MQIPKAKAIVEFVL